MNEQKPRSTDVRENPNLFPSFQTLTSFYTYNSLTEWEAFHEE